MTTHTGLRGILAATIVTIGLAVPALASAGTTVRAFLWDAGDSMDLSGGRKIEDHAPRAGDTMGIALSATVIPAGEVTFDVLNTAATLPHEMVLSRLPAPDGTLPYMADAMRVDEEAAGSLGEVAELEPGQSGALTLTLKPGTYVVYCNIPGHYAAGMWQIVKVVAPDQASDS